MAFAFPLSVANFMDILPIEAISLATPEQVEINQTGGGEVMQADLAPMLWQGEIKLGEMTPNDAALVTARLDILRPAGRSFYLYDTRRPGPLLDLTGAALGASTPTIHTLAANNRDMRIQGLPVGYRLSVGDYLAFDYGTTVIRRALHRIVSAPAAVPTGGISPTFEVSPMIRPGAAVGASVTLIDAACKALVVPNSINVGVTSKTITNGMSFRFMQTLR
ncbi:hypothetical protein GCM10010873_16590 [Cypionkella aquatica]|uniref:Uncharacterized protein n=1 Tax=Cypionkella aquatica TaxID=1756042 RepID=A0AA37TVQ1_9RHOB|nr:hypothetical protein [Cypionkella aquatica]GLS86685.1 hypothetical protein GCM10010873_16590 [Cypionkella aquatica]